MDVDTTDVQIWIRQDDGTHQMRWVSLRVLMQLMQETTVTAHAVGASPTNELPPPVAGLLSAAATGATGEV